MASAPDERRPVLGRVDSKGRLAWADPELAALQVSAGSRLGAELALPTIAAIARLAAELGVEVFRPARIAGSGHDVEVQVRATPDGDEVALALENWAERPIAPQRLAGLVSRERAASLAEESDKWAVDSELRIASLSPVLAERLEIAPAEAIGQPLTRLFKLEESEDGALPLIAGLAARTAFRGQRARLRTDGTALVLLSGRVIQGADGRFAGFEGEARVEQSSGASESSELDQALDEALRSPLDRIIDSADRIVHQSAGPLRSEYADYATDIAAAARHLLSVVQSLTGAVEGRERVDLAAIAAEASTMLDTAAQARGVAITCERPGAVLAEGDRRSVTQILVNLIANAVRHSPSGETVAVTFDHIDGAWAHVSDHGSGIAPEDHDRIFEPFERGSTDESGVGLGLAISRRLARAMGGDILVQSEPGVGSRFSLRLPAA